MRRTKLLMGTVVDIQVVVKDQGAKKEVEARIDEAFEAFRQVERACSRFNPDSELMKSCRVVGTKVPISPLLFEPLRFALQMAEQTEGRFDPTVGKTMELLGFNRHYLNGCKIESSSEAAVSYRDITISENDRSMILHKPLVIDLGATAKGFAVDLAAQKLKSFEGFLINAGGDLYAGGEDWQGRPWRIGIQHPEHKDAVLYEIEVTDRAVCTSGGYERRSDNVAGMHHIIDPFTKESPRHWSSCSVIAPYAMMADAFSTASFVLDGANGPSLLEEAGLQGIFITSGMRIVRIGGI